MTQKTTLVFPSLNDLFGFVREFTINYIDISNDTFTLVCNCEKAEIEVAEIKYHAKAI